MKKLPALFLSIVLVFAFLLPCYAFAGGTVYYLDSVAGNDANNGTSAATPWKTLERARAQTYGAGDKILLKAGDTFDGFFVAQGNGTGEQPVVLGAYGDVTAQGKPIVRNNGDVILCDLHNVSGWVVENILFTAPDGHGVRVLADNGTQVYDVTLRNCDFHNICNKALVCKFPINLCSSGALARLHRITVQNCKITDCGYGIGMSGLSREWAPEAYTTPAESYNTDYLIEGVSLNRILYDGIIIMSVYGMTIRNCSLLNTCLLDDHPTAPMWSHHASNFLIENCEIAGALNMKDGMAVDFDGWTTDATYQYIYSHDNVRFVQNCCYDNYTCNRNCTVRYCLSVNDNKAGNNMAQMLTSGSLKYNEDEYAQSMDNFKFYNNTLINASSVSLMGLKDAYIANNIFTGDLTTAFRFARKFVGNNGEKVVLGFDGVLENNVFWGTAVPTIAKNSKICNPGFAGTDLTDPTSFMLAKDSPLIGAGVPIADGGKTDFYGNPLGAQTNIGCYGGQGENAAAKESVFATIKAFFNTVLGVIYNFIYTCNDLYWIF